MVHNLILARTGVIGRMCHATTVVDFYSPPLSIARLLFPKAQIKHWPFHGIQFYL